jgi:hypothetical protein
MSIAPATFCGRTFRAGELALMRQTAREFSALGVTEIARTVCELLEWKRPRGGLKNRECRQLLERLHAEGFLQLPALRKLGGRGPRREVKSELCCEPASIACAASECEPLELMLVEGQGESRRWREQVERYHYLDVACRSARTCGTGSAVASGSWHAYSGHRPPGRCKLGTSGLAGTTSSEASPLTLQRYFGHE